MCNQVFPRIIMIIFFSAGLSALTYAQIAVKSSNATTSTYDYTMIDQYALVVPQSAQQSITSLAAYLSKKATNEREKARSIFIWVGNNISYDLDNVATGKWEQRPEYVLKVRSTDCLGRSRLFEKLALAAGLEAVVIGGRVKSFEISPTHGMKYATISPNGVVYDSHSWNAIKINGNWQLIDVTAAGGKSKKQGRLEEGKPVDPYFFLTPASEFIYTHLPDEDRVAAPRYSNI